MKKLFFLISLATLGGFLFVVALFVSNLQPINANDTQLVNFVVNPGDGAGLISTRLWQNHLVRNRYVFLLTSHFKKQNNNLRAGLFKLSPSMSTPEIINTLTTGGNYDYWLKILEGQRIAELETEFPSQSEGYIFPDSYLIPDGSTVEKIISIISTNFSKKLAEAKKDSLTSLTDNEAIILASLIEREARSKEAKQRVSGILQNRLKINMALQIDATVQYARDSRVKPKVYWTPVSKSDLAINSPYNTYLQPGLPPGPICNPGFDSLYAAYHPIESDYLFYITGNDHQMHYAKTLAEHNANIEKYLR